MTDAEKRLWQRLRARRFQGASFRRQVPLGPFIADFVCHDARLVIELDGGQHGQAAQAENDRERNQWMENRGYRVLRFWNNDVLENKDGVLLMIDAALRDAPPSRSAATRRTDLPLKGGGIAQEQS